MRFIRTFMGFTAAVSLALGLNLLVTEEALFTPPVMMSLGVALGCGVLWIALRVATLAGTSRGTTLHGMNGVIGSLAFLGICITLYAFVLRSDREWDLTREGLRELAPQTIQILESLNHDVTVSCFLVRTGDPLIDVTQDKTRRFLERCQQYSPHLLVEFIDPQREPEALEALDVLRVANVGTVVLHAGARQREIPLSSVTTRLEEREFTNALINVARESDSKVYFLTGHGERDVADEDPKSGGSNFRLWLNRESYAVESCIIPTDRPRIPQDCSVLIIGGYESDLRSDEIEALDDYMANGGRLLLLTDPQIVLDPSALRAEQMRPWLKKRFGVEVQSDIIVSRATEGYRAMMIPDFALLGDLEEFVEPSDEFLGSFNTQHPITRVLDKQMVFTLARSLVLADDMPGDAQGTVLLRSTPDTWAEVDLSDVVQRRTIVQDDDELVGPLPVAVAVTAPSNVEVGAGARRRDTRLVVVGDSTLASNEDINFAGNQNFLLNTVAWLAEQEDLIAIRPTGKQDLPISMTPNQQRLIAWIAILGTSQAVALVGLVVYVLRRRNQ